MDIGFVGLGRMGLNMTRRLLGGGHRVVAWDRSADAVAAAAAAGATGAGSLDELVAGLGAPRAVWIMLPAGAPTEDTIRALTPLLAPGDVGSHGGQLCCGFMPLAKRCQLAT